MKSGKLNVLLHGIYAFDLADDEIVAHIPDMGTEHLYKAGTWLAETNLEEHGVFQLGGVKDEPLDPDGIPGDVDQKLLKSNQKGIQGFKLNPKHNLFVGKAPISQNATECHCIHATLRLPYPHYPIQSPRRVKISKDSLGGESKDYVVRGRDNLECAIVQVLTYDIADVNDLKLGEHPWEPVLAVDPDLADSYYVNLHVFSEPERSPTVDHIRHAFQSNLGLFMGVDLVLKAPIRDRLPDETLDGVHEFELQDLVERKRWLELFGRAIKQGRDVQAVWDDPTPFLGSDDCGDSAAGGNQGGWTP